MAGDALRSGEELVDLVLIPFEDVDRASIGMDRPFLAAYSQLLIQTCHRRGAHAMGGMAAQIPIRDDAEASRAALDPVRADKLREVGDGHDGTWVAHPGLVSLAREIFESQMAGPNQLQRVPEGPEPPPGGLVLLERLAAEHEGGGKRHPE
mgnify:CR=1 FL=1